MRHAPGRANAEKRPPLRAPSFFSAPRNSRLTPVGCQRLGAIEPGNALDLGPVVAGTPHPAGTVRLSDQGSDAARGSRAHDGQRGTMTSDARIAMRFFWLTAMTVCGPQSTGWLVSPANTTFLVRSADCFNDAVTSGRAPLVTATCWNLEPISTNTETGCACSLSKAQPATCRRPLGSR